MYRQVTESVAQRVSNRSFDDPPFVEALDVVFAGFFLAVPRAIAAGGTVPNSWAPLDDRRKSRLFPLQFALAGMNAHINHDLALALVKTCSQRGLDPNRGTVHADFVRINDVLAELVRPLRQSFLDKELVRHGAALSPLADLLTNFSMEKRRCRVVDHAHVLGRPRSAVHPRGERTGTRGHSRPCEQAVAHEVRSAGPHRRMSNACGRGLSRRRGRRCSPFRHVDETVRARPGSVDPRHKREQAHWSC